MAVDGKLTAWNDDKGFGFITPTSGGPRVFAHISAFPRGRRPSANRLVTYTASRDAQNRLRAERVQYVGAQRFQVRLWLGPVLALLVCGAFFAGLYAVHIRGGLPLTVLEGYAGLSVILFFMYALDKRAAKKGSQRTPEATLHLFELIGGWPGALLAQQLFRHKTRKQPFQLVFWCAVLAHCVGLGWLILSPDAAGIRQRLGFDLASSLSPLVW